MITYTRAAEIPPSLCRPSWVGWLAFAQPEAGPSPSQPCSTHSCLAPGPRVPLPSPTLTTCLSRWPVPCPPPLSELGTSVDLPGLCTTLYGHPSPPSRHPMETFPGDKSDLVLTCLKPRMFPSVCAVQGLYMWL